MAEENGISQEEYVPEKQSTKVSATSPSAFVTKFLSFTSLFFLFILLIILLSYVFNYYVNKYTVYQPRHTEEPLLISYEIEERNTFIEFNGFQMLLGESDTFFSVNRIYLAVSADNETLQQEIEDKEIIIMDRILYSVSKLKYDDVKTGFARESRLKPAIIRAINRHLRTGVIKDIYLGEEISISRLE